MMPGPKTVSDLIEALGGTMSVAEFLDVVPSAVSNARRENHLPENWKWRLARECTRKGVTLPERLFDAPPRKALAS